MSIALGVNTGSTVLADFQAFNALTGRGIDCTMYFQAFPAEPIFYSSQLTDSTTLNATPQAAWIPSGVGIVAAINAGTHDAYIDGEAATVVAYNKKVQIRLMYEMNLNILDYGPSSCSDAQYISAYQRIVTRFRNAGATKVEWVWTPNIWILSAGGIPSPVTRYPGDAYVDWIGTDGYMNKLNGVVYTFEQLHYPEFQVLSAMAPSKRYMIGETGQGQTDARVNRVQWYKDLQGTLNSKMRVVKQFGFFNRDKTAAGEGDYTIDTSGTDTASKNAIAAILNSSPFVGSGGMAQTGVGS